VLQELTQLKRDRRSWEEILELMPEPAVLIDDKGRIFALNQRFQKLCEQAREGLYDTSLGDLLTPDQHSLTNMQELFTRMIEGHTGESNIITEFSLTLGQGRQIPVLLSLNPCIGHPTLRDGYLVNIREIQSLREAQKCLEEEKHRFESLFNSISDAVFLAPLNEEGVYGNFVEVNDVACRRLGYSRLELLKMNARSINPDNNLEKVKAFGKRIRRDKEVQFQAIHVAKDGTQIPVSVTASLVNIADQEYVLSVVRDLREQQQRQKAEERFGRLLDHSWDEICIFEAESMQIVQVNEGAMDNLHYNEAEILLTVYHQLLSDMDRNDLERILKPLRDGHESVVIFEATHRRKDGTTYPVEIRAQMSHSEVPAVFMVNAHDITERKKTEERLHFLANYDSLTGLPNRSLMMDRLSQSLANAKRADTTCALFFMDLDGFKAVNDNLGHDAGDQLLKLVARRLQGSLRNSDSIGRLGGDEFIILAQNLNSTQDISQLAEKIINKVAEPATIKGEEVQVTASLGVAIYSTENDDVNSLLRKSDSAMYKAKKSGQSKWCLYQEAGMQPS
jgi:diguanylate cyclase (GGDEF)-like protein/PAS domain S-box-containing protein